MTDQDGLDAFASTRSEPRDDTPPELVWLQDTSDGLEAFAPKGSRAPTLPPAWPPQPPPTPPGGGPEASGERSWMLRAAMSALVCLVLAAAADGLLDLDMLPQRRSETRVAAATATDVAPVRVRPIATRGTSPLAAPVPMATPERVPTPERVVEAERTVAPARPNITPVPPAPSARERVPAPVLVPAPAVGPVPAPPPLHEPPDTSLMPTDAGAADAEPAPRATASNAPAPAPSAPPAVTPAVTPPAMVAVVAPRERDTRAVENVLGQYRAAFNRLDATAALAVWPSVNEKTLARAFDRLADQTVSFDACDIDVTAGLAQAACRGTARYVPKVGSRTPKAEAREWRFSLRKADRGWLIDRVDAR